MVPCLIFKTEQSYNIIMNNARFSNALLKSGNEIVSNNNLDDYQKFDELSEMLLDEGYDLDDMTDFLLELQNYQIIC